MFSLRISEGIFRWYCVGIVLVLPLVGQGVIGVRERERESLDEG